MLNNIPNMVQRFGGPAGLAAAISLVAVAINILLPKIKEAMDSFGFFSNSVEVGVDTLKKLEDRIKAIEDKKVKATVDLAELDLLKERVEQVRAAIQAVNTLEKTQAHIEKESGGAIGEILAECPGAAPRSRRPCDDRR